MTERQAQDLVKELAQHGVGSHTDKLARHSNGYAVRTNDNELITEVEQGERFLVEVRAGAGA